MNKQAKTKDGVEDQQTEITPTQTESDLAELKVENSTYDDHRISVEVTEATETILFRRFSLGGLESKEFDDVFATDERKKYRIGVKLDGEVKKRKQLTSSVGLARVGVSIENDNRIEVYSVFH